MQVRKLSINDFERPEDYRQWLRMYYLFQRYPITEIRRGGLKYLPKIYKNVSRWYWPYVDVWRDVLREDSDRLIRLALSPSRYGVMMRQINPLKGIMDQDEVRTIVSEYQHEKRAVRTRTASVR